MIDLASTIGTSKWGRIGAPAIIPEKVIVPTRDIGSVVIGVVRLLSQVIDGNPPRKTNF